MVIISVLVTSERDMMALEQCSATNQTNEIVVEADGRNLELYLAIITRYHRSPICCPSRPMRDDCTTPQIYQF